MSSCTQVKEPPRIKELAVEQNLTHDELVKKLKQEGMLTGVQTSALDSKYTVVEKTGNTLFFIKEGKVVASSRPPEQAETTLLYWRHYLEGIPYEERELQDSNTREPEHLRQIYVGKKGFAVIYDPRSNQVIRITHFGEQK